MNDSAQFLRDGFRRLAAEGLLSAPLTRGIGIAPLTHRESLQCLQDVGRRDLSLGRLFEGHVNALLLIQKYGDADRALDDLARGYVFGVWNTDSPDPVRARRNGKSLEFSGAKAFGSGAGVIERPIVTAEIDGEGRTMCLLPMETLSPRIDWESWEPLGMERSCSFTVDFTGVVTSTDVIVGGPGDYYRQPVFSGGAIRFAAVHFGGIERLADCFFEWLRASGRTGDPFQRARAGEIAMAIESGRQWIAQAAAVADQCFHSSSEPDASRMVQFANMTRLAIERICLDVMERVTRGVGARGLLAPAPFAEILRDLTMYLRQPAPDQALAEVGRKALEL